MISDICNQIDPALPVIELSLNQVGLLIPRKTGVIYQNQTCNVACAQRCAEGILILPTDPLLVVEEPVEMYQCPVDAALRRLNWGPVAGIDVKRADEIDRILSGNHMENVSVDQERLAYSEEAWVYVNVEPAPNDFPYRGFGSCKGILVWANSD